MKAGKKTRAWESARRKLKIQFENLGVVRCEKCDSDFALSFAHSKKRRFIANEAELFECALLCQKCHAEVERLPHSEMFEQIKTIISSREERCLY